MRTADQRALARLFGDVRDARASTGDLQELLLQVVFALLMIFIVAYFMFVDQQKKERADEVMALNRQKLTLALEKTAEDYRVRYGLAALMTQGTDGRRTFEPDEHIRNGRIALTPAAQSAFRRGGRAARGDYAQTAGRLTNDWRSRVLKAAELEATALKDDERQWLDAALVREIENVRLDVRGVQRALAARLLRQWVRNPSQAPQTFANRPHVDMAAFAAETEHALKDLALRKVGEEIDAEVLP